MKISDLRRTFVTSRQVRRYKSRTVVVPAAGVGTRDVLITVIIPTLAKGPHAHRVRGLRRLLAEDLPRQVHQNYEAIVVSDGPNDRVRDLVADVRDPRVRTLHTASTSGLWGHPETRLGIAAARGEFLVRINDDNRPWPNYLTTLVESFGSEVAFTYARVVFAGEARRFWRAHFAGLPTYILPADAAGTIGPDTIDCMNIMVRTSVARRFEAHWGDTIDADWRFIATLVDHRLPVQFVDELVGEKR